MNVDVIIKRLEKISNNNKEISLDDFYDHFGFSDNEEDSQIVKIISILEDNGFSLQEETSSTKEHDYFGDLLYDQKNYTYYSNEELCGLFQNGDRNALNELVSKNKNFIWKYVIRYSNYFNHRLSNVDLFQFGVMGLVKAASRFILSYQFTFLTYAENWIRQSILRGIANDGFLIRVPVHALEIIMRISRLLSSPYNYLYSEYDLEYISAYLDIEVDKVKFYINIYFQIMNPSSVNSIVGEDGDSELIDFIPSRFNTKEILNRKFIRERIDEVLNELTEREEFVIRNRFGLNEQNIELTLEEIGKMMRVTRERIRQIESKALRKLQRKQYKLKELMTDDD